MIDPATARQHVGSDFSVRDRDRTVTLRLVDVADQGVSNGMRQFSLFFHGPPDCVLAQSIYTFVHPELGALDIFIAPVVGSNAARIVYQACFSAPATVFEQERGK
jgi:hypothetical protein